MPGCLDFETAWIRTAVGRIRESGRDTFERQEAHPPRSFPETDSSRKGFRRWGHFLAGHLNGHVHASFLACRKGGKRPRDDLIGHEQVGVLDDRSDRAIGGLTVVGREEDCALAQGFG